MEDVDSVKSMGFGEQGGTLARRRASFTPVSYEPKKNSLKNLRKTMRLSLLEDRGSGSNTPYQNYGNNPGNPGGLLPSGNLIGTRHLSETTPSSPTTSISPPAVPFSQSLTNLPSASSAAHNSSLPLPSVYRSRHGQEDPHGIEMGHVSPPFSKLAAHQEGLSCDEASDNSHSQIMMSHSHSASNHSSPGGSSGSFPSLRNQIPLVISVSPPEGEDHDGPSYLYAGHRSDLALAERKRAARAQFEATHVKKPGKRDQKGKGKAVEERSEESSPSPSPSPPAAASRGQKHLTNGGSAPSSAIGEDEETPEGEGANRKPLTVSISAPEGEEVKTPTNTLRHFLKRSLLATKGSPSAISVTGGDHAPIPSLGGGATPGTGTFHTSNSGSQPPSEQMWELPWNTVIELVQTYRGPLHLEDNDLTTLPAIFGQMTKAKEIHLGHNLLTTVPKEIGKLGKLQILELNDNQISALPNTIKRLKSLQRLNLGNNLLEALPMEIPKLKDLTELFLYNNKIPRLPSDFARLRNMTVLSLVGNQLTDLPGDLGEMRKLVQLYLSNNRLAALPTSISNLHYLMVLQVSHNNLVILPEALGDLSHLLHLNLAGNNIKRLPPSIQRLTRLVSLDLSANSIAYVPAKLFSQMTHLSVLRLQENSLADFNPDLSALRDLTELNLCGNELTALPDELKRLDNLKILEYGDNFLPEITESLKKLHQLRTLHLQNNNLVHLIPKFGKRLANLVVLDLSGNRLERLPEMMTHMTKLERLNLARNCLADLRDIGTLGCLKFLDLSGNDLPALPKEVGSLSNLEVLDLRDNQFSALPFEIGNLEALKVLRMDGNPKLQMLPYTISNLLGNLLLLDVGERREPLEIDYGPKYMMQSSKYLDERTYVEKQVLLRLKELCKERLAQLEYYQEERLSTNELRTDESEDEIRNLEEREREHSVTLENKLQTYVYMLARMNGTDPSLNDPSEWSHIMHLILNRPFNSLDEDLFRGGPSHRNSVNFLDDPHPSSKLKSRVSKALQTISAAATSLPKPSFRPSPKNFLSPSQSIPLPIPSISPSRPREGSVSSSAPTPTLSERPHLQGSSPSSSTGFSPSAKKIKKLFKNSSKEELSNGASQHLAAPSPRSAGRRWSLSIQIDPRKTSDDSGLPRAFSEFSPRTTPMTTEALRNPDETEAKSPVLKKKSLSLGEIDASTLGLS